MPHQSLLIRNDHERKINYDLPRAPCRAQKNHPSLNPRKKSNLKSSASCYVPIQDVYFGSTCLFANGTASEGLKFTCKDYKYIQISKISNIVTQQCFLNQIT